MAFDPAAVAKYGVAGARRRAQRQGIGVSDIRKLTPRQVQQYRQGGSGITKGLGFNFGQGKPPGIERLLAGQIGSKRAQLNIQSRFGPQSGRPQLVDRIAQKRRRKGGPAGGRPYLP